MNIVPVIIAGGIGERFWPYSRTENPKQLLKLMSNKTMIEETLDRVRSLYQAPIKPLIVTSKTISNKIKELFHDSDSYDCIVECEGKNTAPAVCIAAMWVQHKYGKDALMLVLPADHAIFPHDSYISAVQCAMLVALNHDALVVFGIKPIRPDTGYGYILLSETSKTFNEISYSHVTSFVEKPSVEKAIEYYKSSQYLWNSGMFVWNVSTILNEFKNFAPEMYQEAAYVSHNNFTQEAIDAFYMHVKKDSIDYAIMEKSDNVYAVCGNFIWDDVGSWESLTRILPADSYKNTVHGKNIFSSDCNESIVINASNNRSLATIGLENIAVIMVDDAVLVIHREKLPEFKSYVTSMKKSSEFPSHLF